jgi:hypothetical protein
MQGGISLDPKKVEKKGFQFKALKKEKIEGYLCSVWEIKGVGANADVYGTVWAADELGKIPLKIQLQYQGDYSAEFLLTDIKNTEVNVATFFPPQGYTAYEPKIVTGSTSEAFPQDKQTEAINKAVKNRQKQN